MVKQIVRDQMFLSQKSSPMTHMDAGIIADMQDTLAANQARCVGMAGNMIGYKKRIIIVSMGFANVVMLNPVLLSKSGAYETEEGCLSLDGTRKVTRCDIHASHSYTCNRRLYLITGISITVVLKCYLST